MDYNHKVPLKLLNDFALETQMIQIVKMLTMLNKFSVVFFSLDLRILNCAVDSNLNKFKYLNLKFCCGIKAINYSEQDLE